MLLLLNVGVDTSYYKVLFSIDSKSLKANKVYKRKLLYCNNTRIEVEILPPEHLFLDSAPNIGPLISRWELGKFKNC